MTVFVHFESISSWLVYSLQGNQASVPNRWLSGVSDKS